MGRRLTTARDRPAGKRLGWPRTRAIAGRGLFRPPHAVVATPHPRESRPLPDQEDATPAPRIILHPTDFSERAEAALEVAYALAREGDGRLVALRVLPDAVAAGVEALVPVDAEAARAALARLSIDPGGRGLAHPLGSHLSQGDPAEEILRTAAGLGCDLIVMGTQGRSGLARALMGSVAEGVMRRASCPVEAVRKPHGVGAAQGPGPAVETRRSSHD